MCRLLFAMPHCRKLIAVIGDVCDLFTPVECLNFFKAVGYTS